MQARRQRWSCGSAEGGAGRALLLPAAWAKDWPGTHHAFPSGMDASQSALLPPVSTSTHAIGPAVTLSKESFHTVEAG